MTFWWWISRFGQAEVVLPCLLAFAIWLAVGREGRLAAIWLACLLSAVAVTVATKIAFLGWGLGIASLDFTGVSGHSMLSAAVWPVLLSRLAARQGTRMRPGMALAGYALAMLVAISRIMLGAHSLSEVVAGFALGALVSAAVLLDAFPARRLAPGLLASAVAFWLAIAPVQMPSSQIHGFITRLALQLSNHPQPYTRDHLVRKSQVS